MKTVVILLNSREIERFELTQATMLIGRSPTCDVIMRAKAVKPLHFVIEWFGEGEFNPDKGFWSINDISHTSTRNSSGEGVILGSESTRLGSFEFKVIKDELAQSHLKRGVLKRSVEESFNDESEKSGGISCLEVVTFRNDLQKVDSVSHFHYKPRTIFGGTLRSIPQAKFKWNSASEGSWSIGGVDPSFQLFNKNEPVVASSDLQMSNKDLYILKSKDYDYYLRLVPKVKIAPHSRGAWDETLISISIIILVLLLFAWAVPRLPVMEIEKPVEERIARVEVVEPVIPQPEPEPLPEERPPEVTQAATAPVQPEPKAPPQAKLAAPSVKTVEKAPAKPNPGINIKAPVKNSNQLGILGAIKANRSSGKGNQVKADQFLPDRSASELDTADGSAIVSRNKVGLVGNKNESGGGKQGPNLESASTTLQSSFVKSKSGNGVIAKSDGSVLERGIPSQRGKDIQSGSAVGLDDVSSTEVKGGLDKESVRQAIRENQVQIRACYERALSESSQREFSGKMTYFWKITPDGDVVDSKLVYTDFKRATFENCVKRIIDRIIFPKAANKQPTFVKYPFLFQGKKN